MSKMSRRKFLEGSATAAAATTLAPLLSARAQGFGVSQVPDLEMQPGGEFVEATVPDSLLLADRARLAVNGLTGTLDPEHGYEVYQLCSASGAYPYFTHENTGLPTINPKYAEALPMMRVMSGSTQNPDHDSEMMKVILSRIKRPGLYYVPPATETYRPWCQPKFGGASDWTANIYGNSRLLLACLVWRQYTGDPAWDDVINTLTGGLIATAVYKDDYAYYPDAAPRGGEPFSYAEPEWSHENEPVGDDEVSGESLFMYTGGEARALARAAATTGNEKALDLSGRICRFMMKPKFWGLEETSTREDVADEKDLANMAGAERGLWRGHTAGRLEALRGLIEYANVADDNRIKEFVRSAYAWMRNYGFARVGFYPVILGSPYGGGPCGASRGIALIIKLTESGTADYWEDVDQYVRNVLVGSQRLPQDCSEDQLALSASVPEIPADVRGLLGPGGEKGAASVPGSYTTDHVVQRHIGAFGHGCCTSNGSTGLYYAWEAAVRYTDPVATVNLLLNRASPWVDVDSYLPYEGKVVLHNKKAKKLSVRIPAWVATRNIRCRVNDNEATPFWVGRYLVFGALSPKDKVTITFPMVTEKATYTVSGTEYKCTFKGNTLVEIEPEGFGCRPDLGEKFKKDEAPMKQITRYVHPTVVEW